MSLTTKILIAVGGIVAILLASLIIYRQVEISDRQKEIESSIVKQKELSDNITRSMSEYATRKDIESFIKDSGISLKTIKDDLATLHAEIKSINVVTIKTPAVLKPKEPSTPGLPNPNPQMPTAICNGKVIPCPNADPFGYLKNRQEYRLTQPFGTTEVPIGRIGFSAWEDKPWYIEVYPREYRMSSVVGMDENQRQYFYNKFTIVADGKEYDLPITTATTQQVYPEAKFSFWNPRLFLGVDAGLNLSETKFEFSPNVNVGIMSYGIYKTQPDFSFLQVGLGYGAVSDIVQFIVTPVSYNVGKHLPLMNNLYIGPSLYFGTNGNVSIMGGIRTAL